MLVKRVIVPGLVVFVAWEVIDYIVHGMILASAYASTPALWRPHEEMKVGILTLAVFVAALSFTSIWSWLISPKSSAAALKYGLVFGIGAGISMGYATYAVQPIPYVMALTWFLGCVVHGVVGGVIVGAMVKD